MYFKKRLNASNFSIYGTKRYCNPDAMTSKALNKDFKRFSYIGRLIKRYYNKNPINLQLLLNHFIILKNVFGERPSARLLFFYYEPQYQNIIKTILTHLDFEYGTIPEEDASASIDLKLLAELEEL